MTTLNLSDAQADGRACVSCGAESGDMVPVGRSDTGSQVFACVGGCAALAGLLIGDRDLNETCGYGQPCVLGVS